jgi:hypothetical protein
MFSANTAFDSSEFKVAEIASEQFLTHIGPPAAAAGIDFKAIPMKPTIQPLLGFIVGATNAFAHFGANGQLGGPGAINAALRVYQTLLDPRHTEALMETSFELTSAPTDAFDCGRRLGINFAVAAMKQDSATSRKLATELIHTYYSSFCSQS